MGKVTYCKDGFSFDKGFGFTGSASGNADTRSHPQQSQNEFGDGLAKGGSAKKMARGGAPTVRSTVPGISRAAPTGAAPGVLAAILKSPMVRAAANAAKMQHARTPMPQIAGAAPVPAQPVPGMKKGGRVPKKDFKPGGEKGKLHRELHVPEDQKIPADRLEAAVHSKNPEVRRDAIRAKTMKSWHHG